MYHITRIFNYFYVISVIEITAGMGEIEIFALSLLCSIERSRDEGTKICTVHISECTSLIFSIQDENGKDYQSGMTLNEA